MIQNMYAIVVKDTDGFDYPYSENDQTFIFSSKDAALVHHQNMIDDFKLMLTPVGRIAKLFGVTHPQLAVPDSMRKQILWFIERSSVKGVVVKL